MIWHDFHFDDLITIVGLLLKNKLFQADIDPVYQDLAPILGAPDDVIVKGLYPSRERAGVYALTP